MTEPHETESPLPGWWSRTAMTLVRLALLVFLIWTLFSARFARETPIAGDVPSPNRDSRTIAEPCPTDDRQIG